MGTLNKILENWSYDDAVEYFYYKIEGSYMGEKTPIFINLVND